MICKNFLPFHGLCVLILLVVYFEAQKFLILRMFSLFFLLLLVLLLSYIIKVVLDLLPWPEGAQFQRLPLGFLTLIALIPQAMDSTWWWWWGDPSSSMSIPILHLKTREMTTKWIHRTSGLTTSWILARVFPQDTTGEVFMNWATMLCQGLYVSHILLRMRSSLTAGKCGLVLKTPPPIPSGWFRSSKRHSDGIRYTRGLLGKHLWRLKWEDTQMGRAVSSWCRPNTCAGRGERLGRKSLTLQHSSEKVLSKLMKSFPGKIVC